MRRSVAMVPLVLGFMLVLAGPAHAALITFEFGGQVTSITDASNFLQGRIVPGQAYSARYSFDSQAPDTQSGDPQVGAYLCASNTFQMVFGQLTVAIPKSRVVVGNHSFGDAYSVDAVGAVPGDFPVTELVLNLEDPTGAAFSNDSLPLSPPSLTRFTTRSFSFDGDPAPNSYYSVHANVTYIQAIPEPGSLLALSVGLAAVLTRRRWGTGGHSIAGRVGDVT